MNERDPRSDTPGTAISGTGLGATDVGVERGIGSGPLFVEENRLPDPTATNAVMEVGRLELREERAFVERRREIAGQVRVRREVERRVETVEVELLTETIVIEVVAGSSGVFIDGTPLLEGESREIVTYREEAEVVKKPVVNEEVRILKKVVNRSGQFSVDLGREVLRVEHIGAVDLRASGPLSGTEEGT